ncbi:unnamed protein product [Hymenolepis diminuta]|uniref:Uncharacterized protein n=1 Tax=Hymenolepis diminuta TaxID=6216 RepID=A0A564YQE7_HYMDI|nr:unnamed protein product [Hymenolepis diminuta]
MTPRRHVQTLPSISPLFYYRLVSPKNHICAYILMPPYPSDSYKALFSAQEQSTHISYLLLRFLLVFSVPQRAPLSISLSHTRFKHLVIFLNTFWSNQLLVFCSTIVVSCYSNSYELVTVTAVT